MSTMSESVKYSDQEINRLRIDSANSLNARPCYQL
uniref:Uncharacterized protein n=1 Tax=Arundo donax TaxID=35708 RepID=A0A0A8YFK5_ARUDO